MQVESNNPWYESGKCLFIAAKVCQQYSDHHYLCCWPSRSILAVVIIVVACRKARAKCRQMTVGGAEINTCAVFSITPQPLKMYLKVNLQTERTLTNGFFKTSGNRHFGPALKWAAKKLSSQVRDYLPCLKQWRLEPLIIAGGHMGACAKSLYTV